MKKVFKGLLLLLLVLFPAVVKADMGAPMIATYEATVIVEGGTDCKNYNQDILHLDKGEKVIVDYESEDEDGDIYLGVEYNDTRCYVKSTDVMPTEEAMDLSNKAISKLENPPKFLVYADEVEVRKGPSVSYEVVGKLKKGTIGKYLYEVYESSYIYVEAGEVKGWVDIIDKKVLTESDQFILGVDTESDCGIIPANTIIKDGWDTSKWDMSKLVNYKGCETFIRSFKNPSVVSLIEPVQTKTLKEITLYETSESEPTAQKEILKIPAGEQIKVLSDYTYSSRLSYEPSDSYFYIEYGDTKGWVLCDNSYYEDDICGNSTILEHNSTLDEEVESKEKDINLDEEVESGEEDIAPITTGKKSSSVDIVITCVVVAFAIALGAIVTLILVNRKKKKTVEPQPVQQVEEPVQQSVEQPEAQSEEKIEIKNEDQ